MKSKHTCLTEGCDGEVYACDLCINCYNWTLRWGKRLHEAQVSWLSRIRIIEARMANLLPQEDFQPKFKIVKNPLGKMPGYTSKPKRIKRQYRCKAA